MGDKLSREPCYRSFVEKHHQVSMITWVLMMFVQELQSWPQVYSLWWQFSFEGETFSFLFSTTFLAVLFSNFQRESKGRQWNLFPLISWLPGYVIYFAALFLLTLRGHLQWCLCFMLDGHWGTLVKEKTQNTGMFLKLVPDGPGPGTWEYRRIILGWQV